MFAGGEMALAVTVQLSGAGSTHLKYYPEEVYNPASFPTADLMCSSSWAMFATFLKQI